MPPKKDFAAFLKKNQKKGPKGGAKAEDASQAQESETKADLANELNKKDENTTVTKKQNNNSSDDEEEDELDLATKQQVSYGTVKENKDIAKKNDKNDELVGYGLDEGKEEKKAQDKPVKKAAFGEGASFGRPTFGGARRGDKTKFGGGDFSAGLDDLDNPQAQNSSSNKQVEETKTEQKGPVKPTFRGRMNLTGGPGANDNNSGVKTNYDFGVVYSTKRTEGEGGKKTEGENRDNNEQRRGQRKQRDHGTEFGKEKKQDDDDDDFTLVRDTKTRPKRKQANDSDSDDDDTRGNRGGFRGARVQRGGERGRGGFFKNSAKRSD